MQGGVTVVIHLPRLTLGRHVRRGQHLAELAQAVLELDELLFAVARLQLLAEQPLSVDQQSADPAKEARGAYD